MLNFKHKLTQTHSKIEPRITYDCQILFVVDIKNTEKQKFSEIQSSLQREGGTGQTRARINLQYEKIIRIMQYFAALRNKQ